MGRYVTSVGTSVSRIIEDAALPNAIRSGVIKSIFEKGDVAEYATEELLASIGVRAERMYEYADRAYVHGLPSGEVYSTTQGRHEIEIQLEYIEGTEILIEYSRFGPANLLHFGWKKLIDLHGYVESSNELVARTALKGSTVYLKDLQVVLPTDLADKAVPFAVEQWGLAANSGYTPERTVANNDIRKLAKPSPIIWDSTVVEACVKVTSVWLNSTGVLQEEVFYLSIPEDDEDFNYFHVKYYVSGLPKYWTYRHGAGTYPVLDAVLSTGTMVSGEYFPFAYFRYNKQSVIADKTTDAYKTSKKMVGYLGVDYDLVADTIDENPDIDDVEQAMMVFAVPAVSTDPHENQYLFDYFDNLFYATNGVSGTRDIKFWFADIPVEANSHVIQDAQFKMELVNYGIFKQIKKGSIGAVGTHSSSYATETSYSPYIDELGVAQSNAVITGIHSYRKQVSEGLYEEVLVKNLQMIYWVYDRYTVTADETDNILLIPIDRSITKNYSIPFREVLYARSLHMVFNSRVVTKLAWYQTGVFQVVMIIVAIVITIYTFGADGGSLIATVLGLTGVEALVATIIFNLVVGQLLSVAFKLFAKAVGADVAMAFAVLAIAVGGYQVIQAGGIQGTFAPALLQLSNGLAQAAFQVKAEDLLEEQKLFQSYAEEQTKLLESAQELLETSTLLQPFVIFGEKPEDFYNRTVHFGNIGTLGFTAVSSFVDTALTLPKINDTLGEPING